MPVEIQVTARHIYGIIAPDTRFLSASMKYIALVITLFFVTAGCATGSGSIDSYVQKLQWLDTADPQADAKQALKKADFRLLGLATRGVSIPGVVQKEMLKYELRCGLRLIDGISDVVRSAEHLRLMQEARSYALKYNAIIKLHCKP